MKIKFYLFFLLIFFYSYRGHSQRYVKVLERHSLSPLDSIEVRFYHVDSGNFTNIGLSITDSSGIAKVPDIFRGNGKLNIVSIEGRSKTIWPDVRNVAGFDTGTYVFYADFLVPHQRKVQKIYFASGKSKMIDFYKNQLDTDLLVITKVLKDNPSYKIKICGYTDDKGGDAYNLKLSQKRSEEVKKYLISKGIAKDKIVIKGYGQSSPRVPNEKDGQDDPEGMAQNRRVEFRMITKENIYEEN